jgi:hypothetical protein
LPRQARERKKKRKNMKIENDQIIIEPADLSKLSSEVQSALAATANNRTVLLRLPMGALGPAEYLSAILKEVLESARKAQVARRFNTLRKGLEEAEPTKRNQAEALIEQAETAVGVS